MPESKIALLAVCPPTLPAVRLLERLRGQAEVRLAVGMEAIAAAAPDAEVILYSALAGGTPPFRDIWPHTGARMRWVHSFEAGVDRLLIPELIASPVQVSNARGVYAEPLAEFTVFAILFFYKQARRMLRQQLHRQWQQFEVESPAGKTLVALGYGGVGAACAGAARKLGMKIVPVRRRDTANREHFRSILATADVVLAAAPLTAETRHLLGAAEFAAMRRSALLINVGRGPVVDEAALIAALHQDRIAGAALDVFEREPLAPDHPFWSMENVLLSPHCTDRTREPNWTELGMRCFLANYRRYRAGKPLLTPVDKTAGY